MFRNLIASERRSVIMQLLMSIFVLVPALLVTDRSALAQSAYSYPWCLERGIGGPRSCYYSSYEQCRYEAFTRGGFCTESPYYQKDQDRFVRAGPGNLHRTISGVSA